MALSIAVRLGIGLAFALFTYATMIAKGTPVPWRLALFRPLTEWDSGG